MANQKQSDTKQPAKEDGKKVLELDKDALDDKDLEEVAGGAMRFGPSEPSCDAGCE